MSECCVLNFHMKMGRRCTRIITKRDLELDVCGMIAFDTVDIRRNELKGDAAVFA